MPKGAREGMNFTRKVPNPNTAFPKSLKCSCSYEARRVEAAGSKSICCVGADTRRASAEPAEAQQSPAVASRTCQHDQCLKGSDWRSRAKNLHPHEERASEIRGAPLGAQTTAIRRSGLGTNDDDERQGNRSSPPCGEQSLQAAGPVSGEALPSLPARVGRGRTAETVRRLPGRATTAAAATAAAAATTKTRRSAHNESSTVDATGRVVREIPGGEF